MKRLLLVLLLAGCSVESPSPKFELPPPPPSAEKVAHDKFAGSDVVRDYAAQGIKLECDTGACALMTESSLEELRALLPLIKGRSSETYEAVWLQASSAPRYSHFGAQTLLPVTKIAESMRAVFATHDLIRPVAARLGLRLDFSDFTFVPDRVQPYLDRLLSQEAKIRSENARVKWIAVGDYETGYQPGRALAFINSRELGTNFEAAWLRLKIFFRAQDAFGNFTFKLEANQIAELETMLAHTSEFSPVLRQLQGRKVRFYEATNDNYGDIRAIYADLMVSQGQGAPYLLKVFTDAAAVTRLEKKFGKQIAHEYGIVDLEGHEECLAKVEAALPKLNNSEGIVIVHGRGRDHRGSRFEKNYFFADCDESPLKVPAPFAALTKD